MSEKMVTLPEAELRRLLEERDALNAQVSQLQDGQSALVERSLYRTVGRFHKRFGHPVESTPRVPDDAQVRFRLKLIAEELVELLEAALVSPAADPHGLKNLARDLPVFIDACSVNVNLPEFVDAQVDLAWVNEGTALVMGVLLEPALREVERANMAKDPVYVASKDEYHQRVVPASEETRDLATLSPAAYNAAMIAEAGKQKGYDAFPPAGERQPDPKAKPTKPDGWTPPDIRRVLLDQGWKPGA